MGNRWWSAGLVCVLVAGSSVVLGQVNFEHPRPITSPDGSINFNPELATDGAGNWVVVWEFETQAPGDVDVQFARSSDNGATWTTPALLNPNAAGFELR